jgi:formylglycine-generating enzyme required for sulfatase activity
VDEYAHQAKLRNAVHDVEAVAKLLAERFHFVPEDGRQTIVLRNGQASKGQILTELRELRRRIGPEDNLILYFAGHGWYDQEVQRGYWIPPTAQYSQQEDHSGDYLSNDDVVAYLRSINSLHTVLVVDACFAGSLFRELRELPPAQEPASKLYAVRSRWALASGLNEPVEDGALGEHSPFARYLLAALEQPGPLLVSDVAQYVKKAVGMNARQQPTAGRLYGTDDRGQGEFVFYPRAEDPEKVAWQAALAADTIVAYDDFVDGYPASPHVPQARERMRVLDAQEKAAQEKQVFQAAQKSRSLADLNDYLDKYPAGSYAGEAWKLKQEIKEAKRLKEKEEIEKFRQENLAEEKRRKAEEEARQKEEAERQRAGTPTGGPNGPFPKKLLWQVGLATLAIMLFIFWENISKIFPPSQNHGNGRDADTTQVALPDTVKPFQGDTAKAKLKPKPVDGIQKLAEAEKQKQAPRSTYTETVNGVSFTMVYVEGGSFRMGDTFGEGESDEKPGPHQTQLDGYHLGQTEVTQALWQAVMGANPSGFKNCGQCPVEQVSWKEAQAFIQKLNQLTGKKYALPTEAQWEFAARERGRQVRFGNGKDNLRPSEANFNARQDYKQPYSEVGEYRQKTTPVKTFAPNALGLYDMSGNVWEWCQDWYDEEFYGTPAARARNPVNLKEGTHRVFRGGSWDYYPLLARAAHRNDNSPTFRYYSLGFRLAAVSL